MAPAPSAPWTWAGRASASAACPGHKAYAFGVSREVSLVSLDSHLSNYSKNHEVVCVLETSSAGQLRPSLSDSLAGVKSPVFQDALRALVPPAEVSTGISVCTKWYFTLVTLPEGLSTSARTRALQFLKRNAHCLLRWNYGVRQDEAEKGVRAMPINSDQNYLLVATDCRLVAGRHRAALHSLTESPAFRMLLSPPPAKPITLMVQSSDNSCVPPSWEAVSAALAPSGALQKMRRGREGTLACSVAPGTGSHAIPLAPVVLSTTEISNNPFITSGLHKIAISATPSQKLVHEVSDPPDGEAHADVPSAEGLPAPRSDGALAPPSEDGPTLERPIDLVVIPDASPHGPEAVLSPRSVTPPVNTHLAASTALIKQPLSEAPLPPTERYRCTAGQLAAIMDALSSNFLQLSSDNLNVLAHFVSSAAADEFHIDWETLLRTVSGDRGLRSAQKWVDWTLPGALKWWNDPEAPKRGFPIMNPRKDDPVRSPLSPPALMSGTSTSANQPKAEQKRSPRAQSLAASQTALDRSPSGVSPPPKKPKP